MMDQLTAKERLLCEALLKNAQLRNAAEVRAYEDASAKLAGTAKTGVLARMFEAIYDVDAGEVQYALVEAIERSPASAFIEVLMSQGRRTQERAPFWYRVLFTSALNTPESRELLAKSFANLGREDRRFFLSYMDELIRAGFAYRRIRKKWALLDS